MDFIFYLEISYRHLLVPTTQIDPLTGLGRRHCLTWSGRQNHALVQVNHGLGLKALEWLRQAVATHFRLTLYKLYPIEEHAGYSKTLKQFERHNTETVDWVVNKNQVGSNIAEMFFIPFRRSDTNPRDWFENMEDNVEAFCQEDRDWIILAVVRKL